MGLVEQEWLDTLATINSEQVTFTDYVEAGNLLVTELREKVRLCWGKLEGGNILIIKNAILRDNLSM